ANVNNVVIPSKARNLSCTRKRFLTSFKMTQAVFFVFLLSLLVAFPEIAEGKEDPEFGQGPGVEEIVITGDPIEDEGTSVQRIDHKQIQRKGAKSAVDMLEAQSSFNATTGSRGERIFTLRGFDQRQIVVLIDGVPAYIPYDGQVDLNMVPAEMVDHITVIKGPGSVLYGPNGLGGAVNIVTRQPGRGPLFSTTVEAGQFDTLNLRGFHSLELGKVGYAVYGGMYTQGAYPLPSSFEPDRNEDGFLRNNSDRFTYHAGSSVRIQLPAQHELKATASFVDGEKGVPPSTFDYPAKYWRFSVWRSFGASLGHRGKIWEHLDLDEVIFFRLFHNLLDSYDNASYSTQKSPRAFQSWYRDSLLGGRIRTQYCFEKTPWGITFLRLWTSVQHDQHEKEADDSNANGNYNRTLITIAPEAEALFSSKWSLTLAIQTDFEIPGNFPAEATSNQTGLGPLASLRYNPIERLVFKATFARRHRFPTLRERFSNAFGYREPNPDLGPETAWHFGLESSWRALQNLLLKIGGFDAEVQGLIEETALGNGIQKLQNIGSARLAGFETIVETKPLNWLEIQGGYSLLYARRTNTDAADKHLQYRPTNKVSFDIVVSPLKWIEVSTGLQIIGPRKYQDPNTTETATLPSYALWDARLDICPIKWVTLWIRATNLTDSSYQTKFGFPDPGRQIWVGMRISEPE
ncbi:MAG: TonB-dependent receptor, partial [Pseudomonadota bacterium]